MELAAPGVDIYSTYWNDTYNTLSGTSMACPHVSGVAALVYVSPMTEGYDSDGDWEWDPDEVRQKMDDTAVDLGPNGKDNKYGYGLVYAKDAVDKPIGAEVTDIAITAVDAPSSVIQGDVSDVKVTVENVGNQDVAIDINVTLTDDTDGVTIGTKIISGLNAGDSTTLIYSWDTSNASIEDHTLTASHDFADDDSTNDSKSTTVKVNEPQAGVTVTSIKPNTMEAGTTIDVTIAGSGFVDGADVTFENGDGPAPTASNIVVVDGSTITAAITAKSGGPPRNRLWDVRVTSPDGSSGVLIDGFTVTP